MGLLDFIHAGSGKLDPVSPPVGVYTTSMVRSEPVVLILKEKVLSISGDDFSINDATTGEPALYCTGKAFSFHDRKKLTDTKGNVLFNITEALINTRKVYIGQDKDGQEVLKVKKKLSLGSKLEATYRQNGEGRDKVAELSGDFWGGSASIKTEDGVALAHIGRNMINAAEGIADQQTYTITIAPGVDIALMAAMCICFDEAKNEEHESGIDLN